MSMIYSQGDLSDRNDCFIKYEADHNKIQSNLVKQNRIKSLQPSSKSFRISIYVQMLQFVFKKLKIVYKISDDHPQALILNKFIEASSCKTEEDQIDFVNNMEPNINCYLNKLTLKHMRS